MKRTATTALRDNRGMADAHQHSAHDDRAHTGAASQAADGAAGDGRAGHDRSWHDYAGHDHAGHDHARAGAPLRALAIAFAITAAFALVEGVGGYVSGSLALLSDAGHMITDAAALAVAMFAQKVAQRPPSARASYGYARAEVLAAFVNALLMLLIVGAILFEAVQRLAHPSPVAGSLVLVIASGGLAVNLLAAWVLSRQQDSLNARAALLHVMGDILGSLAAIVAGAVIALSGWLPIDPLLSIVISLLILRSTWRLLRQSSAVLMEGVPPHLDYTEIGNALSRLPGVTNVHDLHVWQMGSDDVALSAHVAIGVGIEWPRTLGAAQRMLRERYAIDHVTLQPDWPLLAPGGKRVIPMVVSDESPPVASPADKRP